MNQKLLRYSTLALVLHENRITIIYLAFIKNCCSIFAAQKPFQFKSLIVRPMPSLISFQAVQINCTTLYCFDTHNKTEKLKIT